MITVAVTEGEEEPDMFFMDMKGIPWDGSAGATLIAAWDGGGMTAMQSHALNFQDFPATRSPGLEPSSKDPTLEVGPPACVQRWQLGWQKRPSKPPDSSY